MEDIELKKIESRIITYLGNIFTNMSLEDIGRIITYANDSFSYPGKDYLNRQKSVYEERLNNGDYEGGSEMPGPNNYWAGHGPIYLAVNLFYDTTRHNVFIQENFPEQHTDAMIVLACEVFKKLCPDANEEDKTWFIENLCRVVYSFIRK
jgi:hypothetical protein